MPPTPPRRQEVIARAAGLRIIVLYPSFERDYPLTSEQSTPAAGRWQRLPPRPAVQAMSGTDSNARQVSPLRISES